MSSSAFQFFAVFGLSFFIFYIPLLLFSLFAKKVMGIYFFQRKLMRIYFAGFLALVLDCIIAFIAINEGTTIFDYFFWTFLSSPIFYFSSFIAFVLLIVFVIAFLILKFLVKRFGHIGYRFNRRTTMFSLYICLLLSAAFYYLIESTASDGIPAIFFLVVGFPVFAIVALTALALTILEIAHVISNLVKDKII